MAKDALREVNAHNVDAINKVAFMPKEEPKKETFFADGGHVEKKKNSDKLEIANEYNLKKFNRRENLFFIGGNSQVDYGNEMYDLDALLNAQKNGTAPTVGIPKQSTNISVPSNSSTQVQGSSDLIGSPLFRINGDGKTLPVGYNAGIDYNKMMSQPSTSASTTAKVLTPMETIAKAKSTTTKSIKVTGSGLSFTPEYKPADVTKQGITEIGKFLDLQKGNSAGDKAASAVKGAAWQAAGAAALNGIGAINTGERNGIFDTLDPIYHLAGGRESAVGNALSDTGVALTKSGNPWLMLAGAGLKIVGGLTNAAFGIKEDKGKKQAADASINANRNFMSNASSFDDIKGPASMTNTNVYEDGWFTNRGADKNAKLAQDMAEAYSWADRSVQNNISNISSDQVEDFLRNYSAFGGYLTRPKRRRRIKR